MSAESYRWSHLRGRLRPWRCHPAGSPGGSAGCRTECSPRNVWCLAGESKKTRDWDEILTGKGKNRDKHVKEAKDMGRNCERERKGMEKGKKRCEKWTKERNGKGGPGEVNKAKEVGRFFKLEKSVKGRERKRRK